MGNMYSLGVGRRLWGVLGMEFRMWGKMDFSQ